MPNKLVSMLGFEDKPPQECLKTTPGMCANKHTQAMTKTNTYKNAILETDIYSHKSFPRQDSLTKANSNDIDYDICYDNDDICDDNNDIFDENDDICVENDDICDDKHASKLQISKQKVIGSQCSELPPKIKLHLHKN